MSILSFIEVLFWLFRLIGGIKVDGDPSEEEPDKPPEERERKFTQKRPDNPWNVTKFGTKA